MLTFDQPLTGTIDADDFAIEFQGYPDDPDAEIIDSEGNPVSGSPTVTGIAYGTNTNQIIITLDSAVTDSETEIHIDYSGTSITDTASPTQAVSTFADQAVTNSLTTDTAPVLEQATIDDNILTLYFDQPMDASGLPMADSFTASIATNGGTAEIATGTAIAVDTTYPNRVEITLDEGALAHIAGSFEVVVLLTATAPLADARTGNTDVSAIPADFPVVVTTAPAAPELLGATVSGDTITLSFTAPLDATSVPDLSAFTISSPDSQYPLGLTIDSVGTIADNTLTLTLDSDSEIDDANLPNLLIAYTPPGTDPIQNAQGVATAFSGEAVVNTQTANDEPSLVGSPELSLSGGSTIITLTFDEPLDTSSTLDVSNFDINYLGESYNPASAAYDIPSGENSYKIILTLDSATAPSDKDVVVTLDYDGTEVTDVTTTPNVLPTFMATPVENKLVADTAPALIEAELTASNTIILTFDNNLDALPAMLEEDFVVGLPQYPADVTIAVSAVALDATNNNKIILTLANNLGPSVAVSVAYTADSTRTVDEVDTMDVTNIVNSIASFTTGASSVPSVTNSVVSAPIELLRADIDNPNEIRLYYNQEINTMLGAPTASDFSIEVDGNSIASTDVTTALATLGTATAPNAVTVSIASSATAPFTDGSNHVTLEYAQTGTAIVAADAGSIAGPLNLDSVATAPATPTLINELDDDPPTITSLVTDTTGQTITLTFDQPVSSAGVVANYELSFPGFSFPGDTAPEVTAATVSSSTPNIVTLTLDRPIAAGVSTNLKYTGSDIEDSGGQAASLNSDMTVTVNTANSAPALIYAETSSTGTQVILTYDQALMAGTLEEGDFKVASAVYTEAGLDPLEPSSISVSGNVVTLSFATGVRIPPIETDAATETMNTLLTIAIAGDALSATTANGGATATAVSARAFNMVPDTDGSETGGAARLLGFVYDDTGGTPTARLIFDELVGASQTIALTDYAARYSDGTSVAISSTPAVIDDNVITFELAAPRNDPADTVVVTQNAMAADLVDDDGQVITIPNDTPAEVISAVIYTVSISDGMGGMVDREILEVTFNEALEGTVAPDLSAFTLRIRGQEATIVSTSGVDGNIVRFFVEGFESENRLLEDTRDISFSYNNKDSGGNLIPDALVDTDRAPSGIVTETFDYVAPFTVDVVNNAEPPALQVIEVRAVNEFVSFVFNQPVLLDRQTMAYEETAPGDESSRVRIGPGGEDTLEVPRFDYLDGNDNIITFIAEGTVYAATHSLAIDGEVTVHQVDSRVDASRSGFSLAQLVNDYLVSVGESPTFSGGDLTDARFGGSMTVLPTFDYEREPPIIDVAVELQPFQIVPSRVDGTAVGALTVTPRDGTDQQVEFQRENAMGVFEEFSTSPASSAIRDYLGPDGLNVNPSANLQYNPANVNINTNVMDAFTAMMALNEPGAETDPAFLSNPALDDDERAILLAMRDGGRAFTIEPASDVFGAPQVIPESHFLYYRGDGTFQVLFLVDEEGASERIVGSSYRVVFNPEVLESSSAGTLAINTIAGFSTNLDSGDPNYDPNPFSRPFEFATTRFDQTQDHALPIPGGITFEQDPSAPDDAVLIHIVFNRILEDMSSLTVNNIQFRNIAGSFTGTLSSDRNLVTIRIADDDLFDALALQATPRLNNLDFNYRLAEVNQEINGVEQGVNFITLQEPADFSFSLSVPGMNNARRNMREGPAPSNPARPVAMPATFEAPEPPVLPVDDADDLTTSITLDSTLDAESPTTPNELEFQIDFSLAVDNINLADFISSQGTPMAVLLNPDGMSAVLIVGGISEPGVIELSFAEDASFTLRNGGAEITGDDVPDVSYKTSWYGSATDATTIAVAGTSDNNLFRIDANALPADGAITIDAGAGIDTLFVNGASVNLNLLSWAQNGGAVSSVEEIILDGEGTIDLTEFDQSHFAVWRTLFDNNENGLMLSFGAADNDASWTVELSSEWARADTDSDNLPTTYEYTDTGSGNVYMIEIKDGSDDQIATVAA